MNQATIEAIWTLMWRATYGDLDLLIKSLFCKVCIVTGIFFIFLEILT